MKKQAHFSVCLALKALELVDVPVSYFHHRLWTVHRTPKTLNAAQTSGPLHSLNIRLTQESLSVSLPGNNICLSSVQSQPPNRVNTPRTTRRSSEAGVGSCGALNATQSPLCASCTKGASESENTREKQTKLTRCSGVADLRQVMCSLVTCFSGKPNLNENTPKCE